MKTKSNFNKRILNLFVVLFLLTGSSALVAQENKSTDLKDFKVIIEKTENGIELKGIEGTAWTELKFSLAENKKQAINQFRMTSLN